jgi:CheY-like chemotaxis protein
VLVIDDDATALDLIGRFLTGEGYRVITAPGGEEGLRLAREHHPDLITLDVLMPHMDGWAVLSSLKADPALADIPVILVTMTDDRNMGYTLGASGFLTKPIDRDQLGAVLRKYAPSGNVGATALIVDDDPAIREMMRRGVEGAGWKVVEAANGREALERVARAVPDLILLDLMMPEMDGFECVDRLRANEAWRGIPVLIVTAKDITAEDRARLEGSVVRILEKSSDTQQKLLEEVRSIVGSRAPGKAG